MNRYNTKVEIKRLLHASAIIVFSTMINLCNASVVTWDGGGTGGAMGTGYQWGTAYSTAWDGNVNPGAADDAVFPVTLTRTSISLYNDTALDRLIFDNQGPLSIGGTLLTITAREILVRNSNNAPATNKLTNIKLANNGIISVEAPKELRITTEIKNDGQAYSLTKQESGMLWLDGTTSCTGSTFIAEGVLHINSYNAQLKGYNIVVGNGVHAATLDTPYSGQSILGVPAGAIVTVNTNGLYSLNSPAAKTIFYPETYVIKGGTFNLGGNTINLSNSATTPWERSITMTGGVITNGTVGLQGVYPTVGYQVATIKASDKASTISADLSFGGERINIYIEDGSAPVDLEVSGRIRGNFGFTKVGPGTMAFSYPTGSDMYRLRKPIIAEGGTLLLDGGNLPSVGSNSVNVVAGGTLGGTGAICSLDTTSILGHLTLEGTSGNRAILAPGTVDRTTGDWLCGTLKVGTSSVTNNVTFINYGTLRVKLGRNGTSSRLAIIGAISLSSSLNSDALDIIAPLANVPSGEHVLVTFSNLLTGRFNTVTLNDDTLPSKYVLEYRNAANAVVTGTGNIAGGSIVLIVPPQETVIIIR